MAQTGDAMSFLWRKQLWGSYYAMRDAAEVLKPGVDWDMPACKSPLEAIMAVTARAKSHGIDPAALGQEARKHMGRYAGLFGWWMPKETIDA